MWEKLVAQLPISTRQVHLTRCFVGFVDVVQIDTPRIEPT